jgi:membrane protein YdbS with pleckstrin-like domain
MFGLGVTLFLLLYIPLTALTALAAIFLANGEPGTGLSAGLASLVVAAVIQLFLYPLVYCVLTVAYYDLRVRKEGFDLEVLAQTLQTA